MSCKSPRLLRHRLPLGMKRCGGNTLIGVFIGLLLGLALAAAVAYFLTKSPSPFQSTATGAKTELAKGDIGGKPTASASEKPRFDFYKILPGTEEPKPSAPPDNRVQTITNVAVTSTETRPVEIKSGDRFFLQAGAFQNEADAENQKARLALLGLEAAIQTVVLVDKGAWYRVRLGPYDSADEMNRNKGELAKRGIDASVIKNP